MRIPQSSKIQFRLSSNIQIKFNFDFDSSDELDTLENMTISTSNPILIPISVPNVNQIHPKVFSLFLLNSDTLTSLTLEKDKKFMI